MLVRDSGICWYAIMQSWRRITCCSRCRRQLEIRAHPSPSRPAHLQQTTHTLVNLFESCCSKRSSTCSVCWTRRSDRLTRARCSFSAERLSWFLHTFSEITDSCLQMLFKRSCVRMLEGKLKQEQAELIVSLSGKRKDLKRSWNEAEWHVEMDL